MDQAVVTFVEIQNEERLKSLSVIVISSFWFAYFLPYISMSGSSNENGQQGVQNKRRRYNIQYDYALDKQEILKARLEIASTLSDGLIMENSVWLKNSSIKIPSSDVENDTIVMIPVDLPDEGELADDKWVTTSNWYFCCIEEVNLDLTVKIGILGAIIEMDEYDLPIEWSARVLLPAYVLSPKGRLKIMSDDLQVKLTKSSNEKGETISNIGEVKKISMFGIPDLDGVPRPCSMKAKG